MVSNRFLGSIGNAIDSAASGTFLAKRASGPVFETLDYSDISDYPTGADVDSAAIINLIDSNFLSTRTPGTDITTVITDSGLNHIVPDSAGEVVKIGNYSKGISNVFADSGTTIKISSHTISLSTDHILLDGGTAASDYSGGSGAGGSGVNWFGDRAVNGGGQANEGTYSTVIEYAAIATGSSFSDFGDLTVGKIELDACSSPTRALFWGGYGGGVRQEIDYITIATTGNASDFGDMSHASYWGGACSSGTRGCHYGTGVWDGSANVQSIDYVTIATAANAGDFGDIGSSPGIGFALKAVSSGTRGLWGGGYLQSPSDQQNVAIYYITFDTLGNGTSFGNLTQGSYRVCGAASDATYGLWAGGDTGPSNFTQQTGIEYITMATPGNSTDFGDLTAQKRYINGTNNATRAIFMGGLSSASSVDYVTIQTPGNATAWGDLSQTGKKNFGSASGNAS